MENPIKFYLDSYPADNGIVKIDVVGQNLPAHLFGVSFHLRIEGSDWGLTNYDPGSVFMGADPVVMVQEKHNQSNEVVAGITMKRGENYKVNDGVLMSFYIEPQDSGSIIMDFKNASAVAFENGRLDLNNVEWSGEEIFVNVNGYNEMEVTDAESVKEFVNDPIDENISVYSSVRDGQSDVLKIMKDNDYSIWDVYVVLIVSFFVLSFGYMFYLWFSGRRNKD